MRIGQLAAARSALVAVVASALWLSDGQLSFAQLNETCTASIQNRTVPVSPNGTFAIPNIPVDQGFYRVRVVCPQVNGATVGGQSAFIVLVPAGGTREIPRITPGVVEPVPVGLRITAPKTSFGTRGETTQLTVTGTLPDGTTKDLTTPTLGTTYATSNPRIATVSADGLVTAVGRGQAILSARNEGVLAAIAITVLIPTDADGDGLPDDYERANGLNPNDPADAGQDPDDDGLTTLEEFQRGTNPRAADTDGDGLPDGQEVALGTDPLRVDTDGDGLNDGQEVARGDNPRNPDADGDGIPDGLERQLGLNPQVADATTTVQGRVVDPAGAPVAGASAVVLNLFAANADATGAFGIPRVPAGLGPITVVARAIQAGQVLDGASAAVAPVPGGVTDVGTIAVVLSRGVVAGLVTDLQARPVPGAQVTVTVGPDVRVTTTDATGRYRVSGLTAGGFTVLALDPRTGLRGRAAGTLALDQAATADVRLGPSGTVAGTVVGRDGVTPVGAGTTVTLSGPTFLTTRTDALGRYLFEFVPLGSLTVEAADGAGHRGRTTGTLSATGQTVVADVAFLGQGTVAGLVQDGAGGPVPNATVEFSSRSIFGGNRRTTTDAAGRYAIADVFVGPFSVAAWAPVARLAGQASGLLERDGQRATADVTLIAAGTLTGTVFRAGGVTPVAGARVTLSPTGLAATTDSQGRYRVELLPVGSYALDVTDPSTGDRGGGSGTIAAQDEVRTVDITLTGQGRVVVTVRDGAGVLVAGAQVTVSSHTGFGGSQTATTQPDGTVAVERVLAGPFGVFAQDPRTRLTGATTGTVAVAATATVTVQLQAAGSLAGTVFRPDGATPVPNLTVRLDSPTGQQTASGADGRFGFDLVPVGTHTLEALDSAGNVRARAGTVVVSAQGQAVTRDLVLIGVGTVVGQVTHADGTLAPGAAITVESQAPGFSRSLTGLTDVSGTYRLTDVPVGPFTVTARLPVGQRTIFGFATGTLAADGDTVTADLQFSTDLTPVRITLYDANTFAYELREDGGVQDGTRAVFAGDADANRGASLLDLVAGGVATRFRGQPVGTTEEDGREVVITQANVAGLDVTRKVSVPRSGYFTRALDLLTNPTAQPITVGVRLTSHTRFIRKVQGGVTFDREPRLIATSSGDARLDVTDPATRDRWVVIDDEDDGDPFLVPTLPAVAYVFDGPGAAHQAGAAGFSLDFAARFGRLVQEWEHVTIPAGGTVAFLHFVTPQTSRAAAQVSAERLIQLPPEALAGLSPAERTQIQNFAVPAAGVSALAPLPELTGSVTGRVLAGDGVTPLGTTPVRFRSAQPFFGRTYTVSSSAAGQFALASVFNDAGTSVAIPLDRFTLSATDPITGVESPNVTGSFGPGASAATVDVVFTNTGLISGTVRRASGVVASTGTVRLSGGSLVATPGVPIGGDGSYRITGVPAGTYTLAATVPSPQGSALTSAASAAVVAGQATVADVALPPAGAIAGTVHRSTGEVVVNLAVQARGAAGLARSTATDTGGRFAFADVPAGTVTLEAYDPITNTAATAQAAVVADQTAAQDLTLTFGGTVVGLVRNPAGQPVAGAQVTVAAGNGTFAAATGADGRYRVDAVSPGAVVVLAVDPATGLRGRTTGSFGLSGQAVAVDVSLFASGTVIGTVRRSDGLTPAAGARVSIDRFLAGLPATVSTDSQGRYSFDLVPLGAFFLDVTDPATGDRGRASNQINANGETRTIDITLNGLGAVVATVQDAAGNLIGNARVMLTSRTTFGGSQTVTTGADGKATFDRVLAGEFTVFATDPVTLLGGTVSGSVAAGGTAAITVQIEPAGTILGRVLAPDGAAPVGGATVQLLAASFEGMRHVRDVTSAGDGSFRLDAVPLGAYALDVIDAAGRLRARETGLGLAANGDVATRDLTLVGLGTVAGRVLNPNGTIVAGADVSLRSAHPVLGGFFTGRTDAGGHYRLAGVPAGSFTVTASVLAQQLWGETSGQIDRDGQEVTADVQLVNNAVPLPVARYDANNFLFDIQRDGTIQSGSNAAQGWFILDVFTGGAGEPFVGVPIGSTEEDGREIVVQQSGLAGLDVTRKIFVPRAGYFVRYLDVLTNPTSSPVTAGLQTFGNIRAIDGGVRIVATSSGDALFSIADPANPDRWVVIDDQTDGDHALVGGSPAVAFVFDGPDAAQRVKAVNLTVGGVQAQLAYRWDNVTIPPGGTVAFLHFALQQSSRAAAQASAERLSQLPPEALAGLSPEEIAQVRNFALPADGVSALAPLPPLTGQVAGRVLAGDGATAVPSATVLFRSHNIFYGRRHAVSSGASGAFGLTSSFNETGSSIAVPVDAFTLEAVHPMTFVRSPEALGNFPAGEMLASQDVVFTNTGLVAGTVRRHTGGAVTGGSVQVFQDGREVARFPGFDVAADGRYLVTGLPAGAFTLVASVPHPQGTGLRGTAVATVTERQTTPVDVSIEPTGAVAGTVRTAAGAPAADVRVELTGTSAFLRSTQTDATGRFALPDVLLGAFTLRAVEPSSGIASTAEVSVAQDQTTAQDLTLIGFGTVQVQVNFARGVAAASAQVQIQEAARGPSFRSGGSTDATGRVTIASVSAGAFTVRAFQPGNSELFADMAGTLAADGAVVPVTVALPAAGVVNGQVAFTDGAVAAGVTVQLFTAGAPPRSTQANASGSFTFSGVPVGSFTVRALLPANTDIFGEATGVLANDGDTASVAVAVPRGGAVAGVVTFSNGGLASNTAVQIFGQEVPPTFIVTDASGRYRIPGLPVGKPFTVRVLHPADERLFRDAPGNVVGTDGQELTVNVVLPAVASVRVRVVIDFLGLRSSLIEIEDSASPGMRTAGFTDNDGFLTIPSVPEGAFTIRATDRLARQPYVVGQVTGAVTPADQGQTIDTIIRPITLPIARFDANDFRFDVQQDLSIRDGTSSAYRGDFGANQGGLLLDIVQGGTPQRFFVDRVRFLEDGGQEIVARQEKVGFDVTRKVFVPKTGYFARYLEILTNVGFQPVTVDVRLSSNIRSFNGSPGVVATSSGDSLLDVSDATNPDRWVVVDDSDDADPFLAATLPTLAFGFDSAGGAERAGQAGFSVLPSGSGQLVYQWSSVTVQPGETAAFLHFAVQQVSRAAARASVERLVQLPPEALTGLSPADLAQIRNFAVPPGGASTLAPLPPLDGTVTGRVLAGDTATPIPAAQVRFKSKSPFFGRTHVVPSGADGRFSLAATFDDAGTSVVVPIDGFTLNAAHPVTTVPATEAAGAFPAGQTVATQDLVFSNTGLVRGVVRRHTGAPVTDGTLRLTGGTPPINVTTTVAGDGSYLVSGVPQGTLTVTATVASPQGTGLTGSAAVAVAIGQTASADIAIEPTGAVTGTIFTPAGAPAVNLDVELTRLFFRRVTRTDASGQFVFPDVPLGTFFVGARNPNNNFFTGALVTVAQDQTTTQSITLHGSGTLEIQVNFADGRPAPGASLGILEEARGLGFIPAGSTDATGHQTRSTLTGAFTLRAFHPLHPTFFTEVSGRVVNDGDVVPVTLVLPAVGTVTGRVVFAEGTPAASAAVEIFGPDVPSRSVQTDLNGSYTVSGVPISRAFTVRALNPSDPVLFREVAVNAPGTDGQTLTVNVTLPALATLRVTVLRADGTPLSVAEVDVRDSFRSFFRFAGFTDAGGVLLIPSVPEGSFDLQAVAPGTSTVIARTTGAVTLANHGQTVDVTLTALPTGTVQGTVVAADGQTPVAATPVQIFDTGSGELLASTSTNLTAFYQFTTVAAGGQGFTVRAQSPSDFTVTAQRTGTFATAGETVTLDLTLPISVVKGTVFLSDGVTVVSAPSVFVTQIDAAGNLRTFFPSAILRKVGYTVVGVPPGDFTVTAQDPSSGLVGTASGTVTDVAVPVVVNVRLQPSGVVTGTIFDAANNPVPFAQVVVTSAEATFGRLTQADAQGVYRFDRIHLGSFLIRVKDPGSGIAGSAIGALAADGQTVTVNVSLPGTGAVTGTVFGSDGVTPVSTATVTVEDYSHSAPFGQIFQITAPVDAAGTYQATGIPAGMIRVTASDPTGASLPGFAEAPIAMGQTAAINVSLGNAVPFVVNLDGADGFRYDVGCRGELIDGGTVDRQLADAYNAAYSVRISGPLPACFSTGRLEDSGRELVIGPAGVGGLSVTRKVFVPQGGGFARYLEILSNPTSAPVTIPVEVLSNLGSSVATRIVVTPSETSNTFVVTDQQDVCCDPVLAHVFGGPTGQLAVSTVKFANGSGQSAYRWNVTIPGGQTVILMHFAVQRPIGDLAGARAQAEALVNLTDPNALAGMSPGERSQVLNFTVP